MTVQRSVKLILAITLIGIVQLVRGGEYCCPYLTPSGNYTRTFYCSDYCCGTDTDRYCCNSISMRYYLSYSYSALCPSPTEGEYCCAYYTSYGTYRPSFQCSKYCCGTSTFKYCCSFSFLRHFPSYSSNSSCPAATTTTTTTVRGGEYCCPYLTPSGNYTRTFYCSDYCCGTDTDRYCCNSISMRYYPSYSYSALCPSPTEGEYCCAYYTSYNTYRPSFQCSKYCCGTSTFKYCCSFSFLRHFPSYSSNSSCPAATTTTTTTVRPVDSGEYCCAYYTSSGTYKPSFYCSPYCCGTSTKKYCCDSYFNRYHPSYSYSSLCPLATPPTTTTGSGEYCCAYYTLSDSYRSSFYCSKYCCGTSTSKYCCSSYSSRYYKSYSYLSLCPTPSNNWSSWTSKTSLGTINVVGAIVGSVVGFIVLCVIIGVVICCATGCCKHSSGTVNNPPGSAAVVYTTSAAAQGAPAVVTTRPPPQNPGYGPGIPQVNGAAVPGFRTPNVGLKTGLSVLKAGLGLFSDSGLEIPSSEETY